VAPPARGLAFAGQSTIRGATAVRNPRTADGSWNWHSNNGRCRVPGECSWADGLTSALTPATLSVFSWQYARPIPLRRAALACSCVSGGCSDCHDDRRPQVWIDRGSDLARWNEYGPREHNGQCPVGFLVSGHLGRVSGRRSPRAVGQRAGLGAMPAFRRFGESAVPERHRAFLRPVNQTQWGLILSRSRSQNCFAPRSF